MKQYVRPTLIITLLAFLSQALSFAVQMLIARRFGARIGMDAYWIGVTLPQYVVSVVVQSLGVVFLPVFVGYFQKNDEPAAWQVATGLLAWTTCILGVVVAAGMFFARTFLSWTAPGLAAASLGTAVMVARWTWPTIIPNAWNNILFYLYQAQNAFTWQALVPCLGAVLNVVFLIVWTPRYGVIAVAMASAVNIFVQMGLLIPVLLRKGRVRISGSWTHPGVIEIARLLVPLLLSSLLIRWTPLVDRYLASQLPEGVVSHLGYAFRIAGVLSVLISVGLTTVVFPRLAASSARQDMAGLVRTLSLALRVLWLLIAPVIMLGAILAIPGLTVLFERGAFHAADSHAVGRLLQIYLLSLGASCLGNVTGRVFYALKKTNILAVVGPIEATLYAGYAYLLAHKFGAMGIAASYVLYFNGSLLWQLIVLRYLLGPLEGLTIAKSMLRTVLAVLPAAGLIWILGNYVTSPWRFVLSGGLGGLAVYAVMLEWIGGPEWRLLRESIASPDPQYIPQTQSSR